MTSRAVQHHRQEQANPQSTRYGHAAGPSQLQEVTDMRITIACPDAPRIERAWRGCSGLTSFPLIDTSSGTNFNHTWRDRTADLPLIDTSAGTSFFRAWRNCYSLTSFPANAFDNIKGGGFSSAYNNTALTQTSIDNILVSLVASGIAAGVFDQSGGSAPSSTGEAAIDTLRSRGWTVTVTGGY